MPAKKVICSKVGFCLYTLVWISILSATVLFFLIYTSKLCFEKEQIRSEASNILWENYRLPKDIKPMHYHLSFYPHFYSDEVAKFVGSVECKFRVERDTNYVVLHAKYLNISDVRLQELDVRNHAAEELQLSRHFEYKKNEFYVLETKGKLIQGKYYLLSMAFEGKLDRGIVGFYKVSYKDTNTNLTRYIATTKFEPTDARKAFPCFDEPEMKATFTVVMTHRADYRALSNMPVQTSRNVSDGRYVVTQFEKSVPMSTYLVAFIVGQFGEIKSMTKRGTPFRVFTTPDKIEQGRYALKLGTHMLDFYEDVFDMRYALPKMDMIGIPEFVSGAMEHWGLLTYREVFLLYHPEETSIHGRYKVASVIAHEMVHQWFGNVVTMSWWDDIWLNEGFASYFEYKALRGTDNLPDMSSQFLLMDMHVGLGRDSMLSSHPVVIPITNTKQIKEGFDSISYKKGAALLRMLENVIGEEEFVRGIQVYLKKFHYRNARTEELWSTLQEATNSSLDLTYIMNTWTRQMGYPVVTVTHMGGGKIKLSQERFLKKETAVYNVTESPYSYVWEIPINYTTSAGESQLIWLGTKEKTLDVGVDLSYYRNWVKLNSGQMGYYIVDYPDAWWSRFADILMEGPETFPVGDRLGLVHDAISLSQSGRLQYPIVLDLLRYLQNESNYYPWVDAMQGVKRITHRLRNSGIYKKWQMYVLSLVDQAYSRIQWDKPTTDANQKQFRVYVLEAACNHDHTSCLERVSTWLREWALEGKRIDPNYRNQVYAYGLGADGVTEIWDKMWTMYLNESKPQEKRKLLFGLARAKDGRLVRRLLEYSMDPTKIRDQNLPRLLTVLGRNRYNKEDVWTWLEDNFSKIVKRLGPDNHRMWRIIPWIARGFTTSEQLQKVEKFFIMHPKSSLGTTDVKSMRELIEGNILWLKNSESVIARWLNDQFPDSSSSSSSSQSSQN